MPITCTDCSSGFTVDDIDRAFHAKVGVPTPDQCPSCRRKLRLRFRNFFHLYHRACDLTGKKILSMYSADAPFPVYDTETWWSDLWDAMSYGLDADASKPFFPQVAALHNAVPRMAVVVTQCENAGYCNMAVKSRDCYLVFGCVGNEDCMYGHIVWHSTDCLDCLYVYKCERCYECIDCFQCNGLTFSRDCDNCATSSFLVHCTGCRDCFGCVGLKNKQYHIFNEPHTREEYEAKLQQLNPGSQKTVRLAKARVQELIGKETVKAYHGFGCENVAGDYLYNCRNVSDGYDMKNCEDCRHCATLEEFKDSQDCNFAVSSSELAYNCLTSYGRNILSCQSCMAPSSDIAYCDNCYNCQDCFGCAGLSRKRFCILNKQYTEQEYRTLRQQIVDRMRESGEWGRFFPAEFSPFAYNETIAAEYFPLTKEQALAAGERWQDEEEETSPENYRGPDTPLPDDIADTPDDVTKRILKCEATGKLYKIIPQELEFYRSLRLPVPRKCFAERQRERFALRNPRKLFDRACAKCAAPIQTTYAPDRPETVYCEKCYLEAVY